MNKIKDLKEKLNIERKKKREIAYNDSFYLGVMVANYVVATQLPTLSTDMLHSGYVVEVSEEDGNLAKEMEDKWAAGELKFEKYRSWYNINITTKYLKKNIEVRVPNFVVSDEDEFIKGFKRALWDSDLSHYSFENLEEFNSMHVLRTIKLIRN